MRIEKMYFAESAKKNSYITSFYCTCCTIFGIYDFKIYIYSVQTTFLYGYHRRVNKPISVLFFIIYTNKFGFLWLFFSTRFDYAKNYNIPANIKSIGRVVGRYNRKAFFVHLLDGT